MTTSTRYFLIPHEVMTQSQFQSVGSGKQQEILWLPAKPPTQTTAAIFHCSTIQDSNIKLELDISSIGGTLSDPGGLLSNSIDANLGGVFTGNGAEAFVGGFDLIDQLNEFNTVEGLYTIER